MDNLINFLFYVFFFVLAALDFTIAAKDLSNKKFYWFGFDLVAGIFMLVFSINHCLSLCGVR